MNDKKWKPTNAQIHLSFELRKLAKGHISYHQKDVKFVSHFLRALASEIEDDFK